jgi:cytochrome oxidase Cu insertion factor (SCO1/SenC/PrrC family)
MSKRLIALSFAGGIAAGVTAWWVVAPPAEPAARSAAELMDVLMWNHEPVSAPFELIDHDGKPRTDADFRGKLMLIYFGFTFCSDVCPTDLVTIGATMDALGPASEELQPLFITVDPEKDRPEQLKQYVALFHPRLIGLTGDTRQIRKLTSAYKVYYAKTEPAKPLDRGIDHTAFIYLMDLDGRYLGFFPPGTPVARVVEVIRQRLAADRSNSS